MWRCDSIDTLMSASHLAIISDGWIKIFCLIGLHRNETGHIMRANTFTAQYALYKYTEHNRQQKTGNEHFFPLLQWLFFCAIFTLHQCSISRCWFAVCVASLRALHASTHVNERNRFSVDLINFLFLLCNFIECLFFFPLHRWCPTVQNKYEMHSFELNKEFFFIQSNFCAKYY